LGQRIEAAPKLEGTHALKVFTFDENLRLKLFIQGKGLHHRCLVRNAMESSGGSEDIVKGWQRLRHEIYAIEPKIEIDEAGLKQIQVDKVVNEFVVNG
jgi:hypothetical protein